MSFNKPVHLSAASTHQHVSTTSVERTAPPKRLGDKSFSGNPLVKEIRSFLGIPSTDPADVANLAQKSADLKVKQENDRAVLKRYLLDSNVVAGANTRHPSTELLPLHDLFLNKYGDGLVVSPNKLDAFLDLIIQNGRLPKSILNYENMHNPPASRYHWALRDNFDSTQKSLLKNIQEIRSAQRLAEGGKSGPLDAIKNDTAANRAERRKNLIAWNTREARLDVQQKLMGSTDDVSMRVNTLVHELGTGGNSANRGVDELLGRLGQLTPETVLAPVSVKEAINFKDLLRQKSLHEKAIHAERAVSEHQEKGFVSEGDAVESAVKEAALNKIVKVKFNKLGAVDRVSDMTLGEVQEMIVNMTGVDRSEAFSWYGAGGLQWNGQVITAGDRFDLDALRRAANALYESASREVDAKLDAEGK